MLRLSPGAFDDVRRDGPFSRRQPYPGPRRSLTMAEHPLVRLASRFTIADGRRFRLGSVKPDDMRGFSATKEQAESLLAEAVERIAARQETLYAQDQWSVLLIFQAMDAAGKDSAIKHVFSGINPQGVQIGRAHV